MKFFTTILVAAFAGLAHAQSACLSQAEAIPSCGQACLTSAGSSQGCAYTDFACQCSHQSQINNQALTQCVLSACSSDANQALAVSSSAIALCGCVSSAGPATSAAAMTAAIPSTTNAISVTGPPPSGKASAASTAAATSAATVAKQSAAKTTAQPKFTGGAAHATGAIGGVLAGFLGLLAYL